MIILETVIIVIKNKQMGVLLGQVSVADEVIIVFPGWRLLALLRLLGYLVYKVEVFLGD